MQTNAREKKDFIGKGPLLTMPIGPSEEDRKISQLLDSFRNDGLEYMTLFSVVDIDSARFYPDGILGLELKEYANIKCYLKEFYQN
jgi:hypothetical protein